MPVSVPLVRNWFSGKYLTTIYFEASDEDDFRKTGFSKDGKHQNLQIYLGLLVGVCGYAIGYDIFEGNIYEGHTLGVAQK